MDKGENEGGSPSSSNDNDLDIGMKSQTPDQSQQSQTSLQSNSNNNSVNNNTTTNNNKSNVREGSTDGEETSENFATPRGGSEENVTSATAQKTQTSPQQNVGMIIDGRNNLNLNLNSVDKEERLRQILADTSVTHNNNNDDNNSNNNNNNKEQNAQRGDNDADRTQSIREQEESILRAKGLCIECTEVCMCVCVYVFV